MSFHMEAQIVWAELSNPSMEKGQAHYYGLVFRLHM